MNRRWEQVARCVTGRDSTGRALCAVAGRSSEHFPARTKSKLNKGAVSLEVSPLLLQRSCASFSVGDGAGGRRIRGNQIKMTLSGKHINIFPSVVTWNFMFSKGYELQSLSRLLKGEQK